MLETHAHLQKYLGVFGKTRGKISKNVNILQNEKIILAFLTKVWYNIQRCLNMYYCHYSEEKNDLFTNVGSRA